MSLKPRGSFPITLRGVWLIARGRAEGLNCFADSPRSIMASLTPGIGLCIGALAQGLAEGQGARALSDALFLVCVLLAPVVISHELARWWGREAFWGRYIVAFNWCLLLIPILLLLAGMIMLMLAGMRGMGGVLLLNAGLGCYALWMNWFLARHALAIGVWRAAGLVAAVHFGTILVVAVPMSLAGGG